MRPKGIIIICSGRPVLPCHASCAPVDWRDRIFRLFSRISCVTWLLLVWFYFCSTFDDGWLSKP